MQKLITALLVLFATLSLSGSTFVAIKALGEGDFIQYYSACKLCISGLSGDVYTKRLAEVQHTLMPELKQDFVVFYYPPFAILMFLPLVAFSIKVAAVLWLIASFAAYTASAMLLKKIYDLPTNIWLQSICLSALSGPICQTLVMAQYGPFLLLGFCLFILGLEEKRNVMAAIGLLLLAAKPQLALTIFAFGAGRMGYKWITLVVAVFGAFFFLSLWIPGIPAYVNYFQFAKEVLPNLETSRTYSVTLAAQLFRLLGNNTPYLATICRVVFVSCIVSMFFVGRRLKQISASSGLALAMVLGLFTCPYVQAYDLVLLVPILLSLRAISKETLAGKSSESSYKPTGFIRYANSFLGVTIILFSLPLYCWIWRYVVMANGPINPLGLMLAALTLFYTMLFKYCYQTKKPAADGGI